MILENIFIGLAGQLEAKVNIDYALMIVVGLSRDYLGINKGFSRYYPRVSNLDYTGSYFIILDLIGSHWIKF